ncbi:MAG: tripartite tricarboxylate transporter substrate-binding protein [Pseudomonadota bacterium]|nr:tripartite tricarboxylate transporter substrate-binding protein [Pseudomonadota bacterium]
MSLDKVRNCENAVAQIPDGAVVTIGRLIGAGTPPRLIDELVRSLRSPTGDRRDDSYRTWGGVCQKGISRAISRSGRHLPARGHSRMQANLIHSQTTSMSIMRYLLRTIILACVLVGTSALAQSYPTKPVRIIVPTAPGGGFDFAGRVLAERLQKELGQAFIVENRPGAGTLIGTQAVATAPADGYTLLVGGLANLAFNSGLYDKLPYSPLGDFTPIAIISANSYILVGRKDLPQSSLRELIAYAKANPGRLTIATAGLGTGQHIAAALFKRQANVDIVEIAYKGAQPALSDLLGGTVDLFFHATTTARPLVESGRVKAFAASTTKRDPTLPNVPTAQEAELMAW